ncbi:MAG: hypothetical protein WA859_09425, partial [Candidatus Sulfotelmatobacter sp.]
MHLRTAKTVVCVLLMGITLGVLVRRAESQERKAINLSGTRGLPFSDAIIAGNTLYIAGQQGTDE